MKFDCKLAIVDFFPQYYWFLGQLLNWQIKSVIQGLKLDMTNLGVHNDALKLYVELEFQKSLCKLKP